MNEEFYDINDHCTVCGQKHSNKLLCPNIKSVEYDYDPNTGARRLRRYELFSPVEKCLPPISDPSALKRIFGSDI